MSQFSHWLFTIGIFVNKEGHKEQINKGGRDRRVLKGEGGGCDVREEKCLTLFTVEAVEKRHHLNDPLRMTSEKVEI